MKAPRRLDELDRLRELRELDLLDTLPEAVYDRIVALASHCCAVPIALFSLMDEERQWFKAKVGLEGDEGPREISFCDHTIHADELLVVPDTLKDRRFVSNPMVACAEGLRFYAGVPIHGPQGHPLGTLCIADTSPRELSDAARESLQHLALEIEHHVELHANMIALAREAEERSILTSMVLHDAKNLLTRIQGGVELARMRPHDAPAHLESVLDATERLGRMCENFAEVNDSDHATMAVDLSPLDLDAWARGFMRQERLRAAQDEVQLTYRQALGSPTVQTDRILLERVLLNLLDNALRVAPPRSRISVDILSEDDGSLLLAVEDQGDGIPEELRERIFEPFFSLRNSGKRGMGLGLAMCSYAAQALGGEIRLERSDAHGTRLAVRLPAQPAEVSTTS